MPFDRATAIAAIGDRGADIVDELESHLSLLERTGFARDLLKFTMDPIAEYSAAEYLVRKDRYATFYQIASVVTEPSSDAARAFLQVLRDVYDVDHGSGPA